MKHLFYHFAVCAFALTISTAAWAQGKSIESQIAQIRQLYAEANHRIGGNHEEEDIDGLHHAGVTVGGERDKQPWRAIGIRSETIDFYFDCQPDDPECPTDVRNLIVKINGSSRFGTGETGRFEYLFNPKGELVFAFTADPEFTDDGEKLIERRFYFAGKKLLRVIRDGKNFDGNFSRADAEGATQIQADARRLQNLFAAMLGE